MFSHIPKKPLQASRWLSSTSAALTPKQLQTEQLVEQFLARPSRCLKLSTLVSLGQPLTSDSLLSSFSYAYEEILRRLAMRVRSLEDLPYIVGLNPWISRVLQAHSSSFHRLATYPRVSTLEENKSFATELEKIVNAHANDIPQMAKGLQECSRYMTPEQTSAFLDGTIRNRIAVRLLAEQHIALSHALKSPNWSGNHFGVIDMKCRPANLVRACGSFVTEMCNSAMSTSPDLVIDGNLDATFAYVPVHLEYMLTEILKNAFRATVENHYDLHGSSTSKELPPVVVTISPGVNPDTPSSSSNPTILSLRIRDQGGGVSQANMARIFSYAFTSAGSRHSDERAEGGPLGGITSTYIVEAGEHNLFREMACNRSQTTLGIFFGLGYGLPMSKLYAKYFGGSLEFLSLDGWGSDVFLKLPSLDLAGDVQI